MLDGTALLLLGFASLLLGTGRGLASSFLVVYKVAMLSSSSVVYLTMLFSAWKGSYCCASCMPLPTTSAPGPLGPW
jgi:hypothetical protein